MVTSKKPDPAMERAKAKLDLERITIGHLVDYALELIEGDVELVTIKWAIQGLDRDGDRTLAARDHLARAIVVTRAIGTGEKSHPSSSVPTHHLMMMWRSVLLVISRYHQVGRMEDAQALLSEFAHGDPEAAHRTAMAFLLPDGGGA